MPDYRVYPVNRAGRILGPSKVVVCADDHDAIHQAQKAMDGHDVEIWQAARLVLRLTTDDEYRRAVL